jgi:hypothetical protein
MATAKGGGRRGASCSCEKIVARVPEAGLLVLGRSSRHASDFLDALAKPGRLLDAPFLPLCEKSGLAFVHDLTRLDAEVQGVQRRRRQDARDGVFQIFEFDLGQHLSPYVRLFRVSRPV